MNNCRAVQAFLFDQFSQRDCSTMKSDQDSIKTFIMVGEMKDMRQGERKGQGREERKREK